jgi:hypothetical protein
MRLSQGCKNAAQIYRKITEMGFRSTRHSYASAHVPYQNRRAKRLFSSQIAPAGYTGCATREESPKMRHHLVFGPGMEYALSRAVSHSTRLRVLV